MERDQQSHYSDMAQQFAQLKTEFKADMAHFTSSQSVDLIEKLFAAHKKATIDLPQESIIASLLYPGMANRRAMIMTPEHSTYDWIFDTTSAVPRPVRYIPWVEKDVGIFWVTGKAGSGKSTLMKYMCNDERTRAALAQWAGSRKLLTASHYFWSLGSPMEQNYSGLLRSILYDIFRSCPALIEPICKLRWAEALQGKDVRSMPWEDLQLQDCIKTLVTSNLEVEGQTPCFCFFIDGLDEFFGDKRLADALVSLADTGRTKICASSRPWNTFEDAFVASKQRGSYLELHHHTRPDIAKVVEGELGAKLIKINRTGAKWNSLVQDVIDRAEGVFLWVTLVLRNELIPCLESREDIQFLKERLDAVPSGK